MSDRLKDILTRPKEQMSRPVLWFFGLPMAYILYMVASLLVPMGSDLLVSNSLRHMLLIAALLVVVKYFLKFDVHRFFTETPSFRYKTALLSAVLMFGLGTATTFAWKFISPFDFEPASNQGPVAVNWILSLILVITAAVYEELVYRSYIAHFVRDEITSDKKKTLLYCIASALFFTGAHFNNPEMDSTALWASLFYFIEGFAFMYFMIKTRGIEISLGLHIGNNLVSAWMFSYDSSVIQTSALFVHHNSIGPMLIVQTVICLSISLLILRRHFN